MVSDIMAVSGSAVLTSAGAAVGISVGAAAAILVGAMIVILAGTAVGISVGASVGAAVGAAIVVGASVVGAWVVVCPELEHASRVRITSAIAQTYSLDIENADFPSKILSP